MNGRVSCAEDVRDQRRIASLSTSRLLGCVCAGSLAASVPCVIDNHCPSCPATDSLTDPPSPFVFARLQHSTLSPPASLTHASSVITQAFISRIQTAYLVAPRASAHPDNSGPLLLRRPLQTISAPRHSILIKHLTLETDRAPRRFLATASSPPFFGGQAWDCACPQPRSRLDLRPP